ncbi:DnaD domain protein [Vallitalea pronyensis]|uniref:DnaD domain protein n=1 Tax=Vallitalea pronyensis TaxID=1348613 RepID=A0A8J8MGE9_9FIRM|nr:DnaD domain protein [Vallitalea pronyensis]QUI20838.1 DnaD domain protein [Vallitalea pronyensis]
MHTINLYPQATYPFTLVPNTFIDTYLSKSNGDFVKIYLLLLRSMSKGMHTITTAFIADDLHLTETDVKRALKYWALHNVIALTYDDTGEITSIAFDDFKEENKQQEVSKPLHKEVALTKQKDVKLNLSTKPQYNMLEVDSFIGQQGYKQLIYITQKYLGKMLTQQDINTLIGFNDWLGLPFEVIELLIEYCVSNNHRNMSYIEKVAISWADEGINTVAKATYRIETFNSHYFKVMKALGIGDRQPTPKQIEYMKKWTDQYGLSVDIILEACHRTMETIHQPQFTYIDAILKNWQKNKVQSKQDIEKLDAIHHKKSDTKQPTTKDQTSKFVNYDQRTYNFDELEKKAMELLIKETNSTY